MWVSGPVRAGHDGAGREHGAEGALVAAGKGTDSEVGPEREGFEEGRLEAWGRRWERGTVLALAQLTKMLLRFNGLCTAGHRGLPLRPVNAFI